MVCAPVSSLELRPGVGRRPVPEPWSVCGVCSQTEAVAASYVLALGAQTEFGPGCLLGTETQRSGELPQRRMVGLWPGTVPTSIGLTLDQTDQTRLRIRVYEVASAPHLMHSTISGARPPGTGKGGLRKGGRTSFSDPCRPVWPVHNSPSGLGIAGNSLYRRHPPTCADQLAGMNASHAISHGSRCPIGVEERTAG